MTELLESNLYGSPLRMTPQRKTILEELSHNPVHPTADELFERIRRKLPRISLGTVYRNLEILAQMGLIVVLEGGPQRRYDADTNTHYHIRCIRCGQLEDAPIEPNTTMEETLRAKTDYEVIGHRLKFLGICPTCNKEEQKNG